MCTLEASQFKLTEKPGYRDNVYRTECRKVKPLEHSLDTKWEKKSKVSQNNLNNYVRKYELKVPCAILKTIVHKPGHFPMHRPSKF